MDIGTQFLAQSLKITQPEIRLGNLYEDDPGLQAYLKHYLGEDLTAIEADLHSMGAKASSVYHQNGVQAELNPPQHIKYNVYGRRIDDLLLHEGWRNMKGFSAEEGLISIPYTLTLPKARVYQAAKLYMFGSNSGLFNCPLAMTDGAAFLISQMKRQNPGDVDQNLENAFRHLTSTKKDEFWTSGQWMTEKNGGSDVTQSTQTIALPSDNCRYKLFGYKWFSSATDADMTFALAKIIPPETSDTAKINLDKIKPSLFFVKVRNVCGALNNIEIIRLKNKLGTKQLPTAELVLNGTEAQLVGKPGQGIKVISHMLNITRLHNSIAAVSGLRKMTNIVFDYSHRRKAFGKMIKDHSLHNQIMYTLEMNTRGNLLFVLEVSSLLDEADKGTQTADSASLLRMLTPILKLFTAKEAIKWIGEGMEALGALGYMEDSHVPHILRDSYVLSIWEGTTNVLSLDFLRSVSPSSLKIFHSWILSKCSDKESLVERKLSKLVELFSKKDEIELNARNICMNYSLCIIVALLDSFKAATKLEHDRLVFKHWESRLENEFVFNSFSIRDKHDDYDKMIGKNFGKNNDSKGNERPKL